MHFSTIAVSLAVIASSIPLVSTGTVGDLQDRGLKSIETARDISRGYTKIRQKKQERRRSIRERESSRIVARSEATCLNSNAVQTGSASTGQSGSDVTAGQVNSATDAANFINFCSGLTLTNGLQVKAGSCNGVVMGKIPSTSNMITSVIVSPQLGQTVTADQTFTIFVQTEGLATGFFTNAQETYYSAPQDLNSNGQIIGHTHVTVQDMGNSLNPTKPPDPTLFVFFKGINDNGNGNGLLSATVTGGLPAGNYRVCTMTSSSNHQPVLMPVAQRGAQDDCTKFVVAGGSGGSGSGSGSETSATSAAATTARASAVTTAKAAATSKATSSSASSATVKSGSLGGSAPAITASGDPSRPFSVNGNTFTDAGTAAQRSCDVQFNSCANAANSGQLNGKTVNDCQTQKNSCGLA